MFLTGPGVPLLRALPGGEGSARCDRVAKVVGFATAISSPRKGAVKERGRLTCGWGGPVEGRLFHASAARRRPLSLVSLGGLLNGVCPFLSLVAHQSRDRELLPRGFCQNLPSTRPATKTTPKTIVSTTEITGEFTAPPLVIGPTT